MEQPALIPAPALQAGARCSHSLPSHPSSLASRRAWQTIMTMRSENKNTRVSPGDWWRGKGRNHLSTKKGQISSAPSMPRTGFEPARLKRHRPSTCRVCLFRHRGARTIILRPRHLSTLARPSRKLHTRPECPSGASRSTAPPQAPDGSFREGSATCAAGHVVYNRTMGERTTRTRLRRAFGVSAQSNAQSSRSGIHSEGGNPR
jgi:hypothetical protein